MRSVNKVILIGHVTRDPELRQTASGHPIATFSIATNRTWVTSASEKQESTEFHDLVAWGKLAEICHKYVGKSTAIYVEGRLHTRKWDAPDGSKRHKTEVVITELNILSRRKETEGDETDSLEMERELETISSENENEDVLKDLDLDSEDLPSTSD
jgi:single-strand DNA-binding protein